MLLQAFKDCKFVSTCFTLKCFKFLNKYVISELKLASLLLVFAIQNFSESHDDQASLSIAPPRRLWLLRRRSKTTEHILEAINPISNEGGVQLTVLRVVLHL